MTLPFLFLAQIAVIAHRGEHLAHAENTLAAYRAAFDVGADYFEVDVRTTADGHLVLLHDATVDRTTNGKGAVREMTFAQVRALDAGGGASVPTFEEALRLASQGKAGVYVDCKDVAATALVAALERTGMSRRVVIYGKPAFLKEVQALRRELRVMPEATSVAVLQTLIQELSPRVIAFDHRDFQDEIIRLAKQAKADVYVDRLGPADTEGYWQDAMDRGATGIQTDRPAELVRYLRSKGLRRQ
ncbi:glycerophosphoryl diester phosphodiesterase [Bryobacterales bacterium F-183]|nr:glycerophosphoryl diester phosphodiesterase [Bryobacterales bacterium F-183]